MNCKEAKEHIELLHDDELDTISSKRLTNHLEICSSCRQSLEQAKTLRTLLQKSSIPPPSENLSNRIFESFHSNRQTSAKVSWWNQIFSGSISVPKPIFATAIVAMLIALAAANLIGRKFNNESSVNSPTPEIVERTKVVEVPVIKIVEVPVVQERVVNRVIYLSKHPNQFAQNKVSRNNPKSDRTFLNRPVVENRYFAKASLKGFQPFSQIKTEIIKEDKPNEK